MAAFMIVACIMNNSKSSEPRSLVPVDPQLQYLAIFFLVAVILMELIFIIIIIALLIYHKILGNKLQKNMSNHEREEEKLLRLNEGAVKYSMIEPAELNQLEVQKFP